MNEKIAVLVPCYNEELTVAKVIEDFRKELPEAIIYVYDNNSTDKTYEIARQNGAVVKKEFRQGKGNVIRSMFRDIDADIYIMIDGDDTYPAEFVHDLIKPIIDKEADIVIGDRHSNGTYKDENKRALHNFGNHLVKYLINKLFRSNLNDIMSGYRIFSKKFVKTMPINSGGFEIETEMTLHTLDKKFLIKEIPIEYRDRPEGSFSKLNTFSDGMRVLKTILWVFKDYRPLAFFSILALFIFILALLTGAPVIIEFMNTGLINKIPSAILSTGLMMISVISLFTGFILDTIVKQHRESYELYINKIINNL
ncbi:glycosyl transferase, family 2 [Sulfurimonas gotlandica GD1]|uniref:Glycosyl transferase, family 2 n=1 Tax=Sulfurimonas gotlandica (strain DSM 19862 / JCM 16533 / GD1) TaxID=929558 RepID=B6BKF2_SULGG|nr:glycosyltransferase family 2 protein [Sulfurimonas gotlandica]EDZ62432.1 glycosyltransferase [Sulfurimonas gotlandica GD1]EHP29007.1 glycosyl transferase, family 2 [Sulfurimonas gotlandica GD1]